MSAVSDPPPSLAGETDRRHRLRIAVNVEQLLSRSPGGIGRYSGQLATLLATLPPVDEVVPFVARHPRPEITSAMAAARITTEPVVLPWPRPLLNQAWVRFGLPPLALGHPSLAHVDVVHAPSVAVPPRGRTPLVVTVHDAASELWPDAFTARGRAFHARGAAAAARSARRADLVIAVSHAAADEIVAHTPIPASRIRVVHHGVAAPRVDPEARARVERAHGLEGRDFVLWVGSLEPRKGVGTLVAAMARLHRGGATDAPLVLAGFDGWLADGLIAPDDRAALGDRLLTLGPVSEADLWALYAAAAVFALPSRHEGFGLPVVEAMTQATAVVCSDLPVTREVTGGAAMLVAADDVDAWSEALDGLLTDPTGRAALASAGPAVAARYSVDAFIAGTRAVYHEAAGR
jgi:glycosyltransferase involved in cell wall biosynthesis